MNLLSTRKDSQGRIWVVMTDPITGAEEPRHYSLGSFNTHNGCYNDFFDANNQIARAAAKWGIDLGQDYERFYQLGMRVSQQIDILTDKKIGIKSADKFGETRLMSFRDVSEAKYIQSQKDLEDLLVQEVRKEKKIVRNEQYDALYDSIKDKLGKDDLD